MILIVAEPSDVHAQAVARRLERRGRAVEIHSATDFPQRLRMTAHYEGVKQSVELRNGHGFGATNLEQPAGLWLRRIHPHELSKAIVDPAVAQFAHGQCRDLLLGWTATVENVINPRAAEEQAERKPLQLFAAQQVGLEVPRTLISNDPERVREFVETIDSPVVFKTMSPTHFRFTGTTLLEPWHLPLLSATELAPTVFQERIQADRHLRVTIVDDRAFAASITPVREHGQLDWRLDRDPKIEPFTLPAEVETRLIRLRARLGLRYGAVDMIIDLDGRYHFLEINPAGQFLFVEIHAGLPISEAIADALTGHR